MSLFSGPCLVVAEVAQAHDGSLGTAHAYIDAIARAGAGAVKFQIHIAAADIAKVAGMQATRFISKGEFIREADLAYHLRRNHLAP